MTYYVLLSDDSEEEALVLGEESFGTFYAHDGFLALNNIIQTHPDIVDKISIFNEKKDKLTLTEFLDIVSKTTIKLNF